MSLVLKEDEVQCITNQGSETRRIAELLVKENIDFAPRHTDGLVRQVCDKLGFSNEHAVAIKLSKLREQLERYRKDFPSNEVTKEVIVGTPRPQCVDCPPEMQINCKMKFVGHAEENGHSLRKGTNLKKYYNKDKPDLVIVPMAQCSLYNIEFIEQAASEGIEILLNDICKLQTDLWRKLYKSFHNVHIYRMDVWDFLKQIENIVKNSSQPFIFLDPDGDTEDYPLFREALKYVPNIITVLCHRAINSVFRSDFNILEEETLEASMKLDRIELKKELDKVT